MAPPPYGHVIRTHRLTLRPVEIGDAERFVQIQSNWNVTRTLRMADYPPAREAMLCGYRRDRRWLGRSELLVR
jgi:hypothetical protein